MSAPVRVGATPFVDLARAHAPIEGELRAAVETVIARGDFILGNAVDRFEEEFSAYVGARHAVGVNSGTAALTIALRATGIEPGDEVIVPANTYVASALAVVHAGATPIFCDVDDLHGLIDLGSAAAVAGERTAAVMPVHLYGQACDMGAVAEFAERRGLAVIEDAAQAHGAAWDGRRAGSFGLAAGFSFYPSKNLGAFGDGGAVLTSDDSVAERAKRLRNLGQLGKGDHRAAGFNERLDTLQAAVLRVKLHHLDVWNESRDRAARRYRERLPAEARGLPTRPAATDVHHLLPVRIANRDHVATRLKGLKVGVGVHYSPAAHMQPPFAGEARRVELRNAEHWAAEELSLPMFAGLRATEIDFVCDRLSTVLEEQQARTDGTPPS